MLRHATIHSLKSLCMFGKNCVVYVKSYFNAHPIYKQCFKSERLVLKKNKDFSCWMAMFGYVLKSRGHHNKLSNHLFRCFNCKFSRKRPKPITTALHESVLQLYVTSHNRTTTDVTYISMRLTSTISE